MGFACMAAKRGRHLPGRMRRFHEGARNHRQDDAQREIGDHRLRHLDHTRFRGNLGVLDGFVLGGTAPILARGKRLANTDYLT
jgi:hypothetical protein